MDLSAFSWSTVLMLALAIIIAYVGIKFFDKVIVKVISLVLGTVLLLIVLNQFGIDIPVITDLLEYVLDVIKTVFQSLGEFFVKVKS